MLISARTCVTVIAHVVWMQHVATLQLSPALGAWHVTDLLPFTPAAPHVIASPGDAHDSAMASVYHWAPSPSMVVIVPYHTLPYPLSFAEDRI
jgi:hypothetical protein